VERLYSRDHQPLADALELESLQRIVHDLPASTSDRIDRHDSRQRLLEAAWLAQFATKNVNVGVGHALGHQIAGLLDVPHGEIACVLLPYSIQFNAVAGEAQLLRVCSALGLEPSVSALCESVRILVQSLGMPSRLRDIGVPLNSLNGIAERTLSDTAMTGNPRLVERAGEIMDEILTPAW
jgi:alcohol dehydrogenase class IV